MITTTKVSGKEDRFIQGYMCAVVVLIKSHGFGTEVRDVFRECGNYSLEQLKKFGVPDYDLEILKQNWKELNR